LAQVFTNLVANAFEALGGRGRIGITVRKSAIEEDPFSREPHAELPTVVVDVEDNGPGVPAELTDKIFDPFFSTKPQGSGLGLAIVKHLVELHGGKVRAKSGGEGLGATFCVEIPMMAVQTPRRDENSEYARARRESFASADYPSLKGISVLVVDDEPDARELVKRVLEECGARAAVVASAQEGLSSLKRELPDVILCDIGMPEQDGYAFIKTVRRLSAEEGGNTPAAALTAFARAEDRTRALRAGFQIHVAKPVEPTELTAVVATLAVKR